jgi:hypothetical protein
MLKTVYPQIRDLDRVQESALRLLICNNPLNYGSSRTVYECFLVEGCVVKVQNEIYLFDNIAEWKVWCAVQFTEHARWFARCKYIGSDGRLLIQEKTRPPGAGEWPDKIPAFLTDIKRENFGMVTRKNEKSGEDEELFVCHDYALHLLLEKGMTKKMQTVDWLELDN